MFSSIDQRIRRGNGVRRSSAAGRPRLNFRIEKFFWATEFARLFFHSRGANQRLNRFATPAVPIKTQFTCRK